MLQCFQGCRIFAPIQAQTQPCSPTYRKADSLLSYWYVLSFSTFCSS